MKTYPSLTTKDTEDLAKALQQIIRIRKEDVQDYDNLNNVFISGRSVGRVVPTTSADVLDTDRLGDILFTATYIYNLIDNSGTLEWRRVTQGSF